MVYEWKTRGAPEERARVGPKRMEEDIVDEVTDVIDDTSLVLIASIS